MARLEVDQLAYARSQTPLFKDLSFNLHARQLLLLNGINGAGKTTLLKILAGLIEPDQGQIHFSLSDNSPTRPAGKIAEPMINHQAWLGDRNALKPQWSALQNIEFLAQLRPQKPSDPLDALNYFGLFKQRHQPVKTFSQGMKRRLALASLLLSSAPLWLLDEPQAALDKQGIVLFEKMLDQHLAQGGLVVMAAHHTVDIEAAQIQLLSLDHYQ